MDIPLIEQVKLQAQGKRPASTVLTAGLTR